MQKFLPVSLYDEEFALFASLSNEIEKNAPHTIQVTESIAALFLPLSSPPRGNEISVSYLLVWIYFLLSLSLSHIWKLDMDIDTDRDRAVRL